jgi:hypothetical protein
VFKTLLLRCNLRVDAQIQIAGKQKEVTDFELLSKMVTMVFKQEWK